VKFVAVIVTALRNAISKIYRQSEVTRTPHFATFPSRDATHLDGFRVYAEIILATVNFISHSLALMQLLLNQRIWEQGRVRGYFHVHQLNHLKTYGIFQEFLRTLYTSCSYEDCII